MLRSLHIENYVLIERLELTFDDGFSVITGETGAGKSVLMGAIALILGQRADLKVIKDGCSRCVLEASFTDTIAHKPYFEQNDLEYDPSSCTIRRELYDTGKSRAFVNDSPVSLAMLKALGLQLVDVHSQHENLLLGTDVFQRTVLDEVSHSKDELLAYQESYKHYLSARAALKKREQEIEQSLQESDYISFQFKQLDEVKLTDGEQEELEDEIALLSHTESIQSGLETIDGVLGADTTGICSQLREAIRTADHLKDIYPNLKEASERMSSSLIDLQDLCRDVQHWSGSIEVNPERLQQAEERLGLLIDLQKKHRVQSVGELIALRDSYAARLHHIDNGAQEVETLKKEVETALKEVNRLAKLLSSKRQSAIPAMQSYMVTQLQQLGMPHVVFTIDLQPVIPDENGADKVTFFFSANKNKAPQPISEVASGGEISRLMLCVKAMMADVSSCATLLFDEIDTGVSGEMAHRMALLMLDIAAHRQVICITHLPQIAAKGVHHYKVYKTENEEEAISNARQLTADERVMEIASMVSAGKPTPAAIENARQLLNVVNK